MDGIAIQLRLLEGIVQNMMREVESYGDHDDFFQRMARLRFEANDVICALFTYARSNSDCFENDEHRARFLENIEKLSQHFASHQSRWTNQAISRDRDGYIISSALAVQNFHAWIDEMRKHVLPQELSASPWSRLCAKVARLY